jgi:endonuclease YncB( thermonuclease family)
MIASMRPDDFPRYHYRGKLVRVIDGDTAVFALQLGFDISAEIMVRLTGYNAPELRGPNPGTAAAAREYLAALLKDGPCYLATLKDSQSFARYLAAVFIEGPDGGLSDVADLMRGAGYHVPQGD